MTLFIIAWGLQPVKDALNSVGIVKFDIPGLSNAIMKPDGSPLVIKPFEFNYISAPGTAMLLATIFAIPLVGMTYREGLRIYWLTLKQLKFPIVTIASVVGFAFIANNSGMSITIAMALASTG
jgi:lactate permease